jgi:predicted SnoaL-like aldol condensation-catalyzing enzyme
MQGNKEIIEFLWNLFSDQKWEESKSLFHEEFTAHWPQSNEKFLNADQFVEMNAAYPGSHQIKILNLLESGSTVISAVYVSGPLSGGRMLCLNLSRFSIMQLHSDEPRS